jgi:hypothetical protein
MLSIQNIPSPERQDYFSKGNLRLSLLTADFASRHLLRQLTQVAQRFYDSFHIARPIFPPPSTIHANVFRVGMRVSGRLPG